MRHFLLLALLSIIFAVPAQGVSLSSGEGDPNGEHGCELGDLFLDSRKDRVEYVCTSAGDSASAVWKPTGPAAGTLAFSLNAKDDCGASDDGTTDNIAVLDACEEIIKSVGAGEIVFPSGGTGYRIGDGTASFVANSWLIDADNLTLSCDPGAKLMPAGQIGNYMLAVCDDHTGVPCDADDGDVENFTVQGCYFFDDEPVAHGATYPVAYISLPAGGTPAIGDTVAYTGATDGAYVARYRDRGTYGEIWFSESASSPDHTAYWPQDGTEAAPTGGLIGSGGWSASVLATCDTAPTSSATEAPDCVWDGSYGEDTHPIHIGDSKNARVLDNIFENFGDECVDIAGKGVGGAQNFLIRGNEFRNCPDIPSGGSAIAIGPGSGKIQDNFFNGGTQSGLNGAHTYVTANPNGGTVPWGQLEFSGNRTEDTDGDVPEKGYLFTCSNVSGGQCGPVFITGDTISADAAAVTDVNDDQAALRYNASTSGLKGLYVTSSVIEGNFKDVGSPIDLVSLVNTEVRSLGNTLAFGVETSASVFSMLGGSITNFKAGAVNLTASNEAADSATFNGVLIEGNNSDTVAGGGVEEDVITVFDTSCPSGYKTIKLLGLTIIPDQAGEIDRVIEGASSCSGQQYIVDGLYVDMDDGAGGYVASDNTVHSAKTVTNSTILNSGGGYAILATSEGYYAGNTIIDPDNRCIGTSGTNAVFSGNYLEGCTTAAIDELNSSADYNVCIGNISAASGGGAGGAQIQCGPTTGGGDADGCTAAGAGGANSVCDNNVVR